jgi:O-antigen/teichoic acid export membrane protein
MIGFFKSNSTSIAERFSASFIFNILRSIGTFIISILLARFLGVNEFGRLAFLLASFFAFKNILDMYTSHAFFTFLSKKNRGQDFIKIYWYWMAFQLIFSIFLVMLLLPDDLVDAIWRGESKTLVIMALVATFMQHSAWQSASYMAEADRKTIQVQKLGCLVVLIHIILVVFLYIFNYLSLKILFISISLEWFIASCLAYKMYSGASDSSDGFREIFQEFWIYCKPLIPLAWLGFLYEFLDKWMLQVWGGSKEQAFYAVASNLAFIILIATSSIIKVLWKEIAESYEKNDIKKVELLFNSSIKFLYFIGAFLCGLTLPWSEEILYITVGADYLQASVAFTLMLIYPVHQSVGQISGVMLFATEKVKIQSAINIIFMISSIVVAYFLLAPENAYIKGFGMGSGGLAWKMVIMQFIQVNCLIFVISRIFKWKNYFFIYQFFVLGGAIFIAFIIKFLITSIVTNLYLGMMASIMTYISIIIIIFLRNPSLFFGIEINHIRKYFSR